MKKYKILMIDDDPVFLNAYQKILRKEYQVVTTTNISEGIHMISDSKPDVLLLDISLNNEREGVEVLPILKENYPDLPIIMVTNWDSFSISNEAFQKGADYFFIKSQDLDQLKIYIKDILLFKEEGDVDQFPIAKSPAMKEILRKARAVAHTNIPVIIYGETGVGKEVVARYIHDHSERRQESFQAINCAAIPEPLLESELFGFEKGAFTGANREKKGLIELASGGTLFLDEIKDLSLKAQASVLRVLEQQELDHLGGTKSIKIDIRIIAASQVPLTDLVDDGKFRQDLFFRLAGTEIHIPPLRERPEDLTALTQYFLKSICEKNKIKTEKKFSQSALLMLNNYHWPGNVRELYHTLESAVLFSKGKEIKSSEIQLKYAKKHDKLNHYDLARQTVTEAFEKEFIKSALVQHLGNISKTAQAIGLSRQSLQKKIKKYGLNLKGEL